MKTTILFICLLLACFSVDAQALKTTLPVDSATQKVQYTGVVQAPGLSASALYTNTRAWFATAFTSATAVLQMDDKESGRLIGKGRSNVTTKTARPVALSLSYTLAVTLKDGRYQYIISDIHNESPGYSLNGQVYPPQDRPIEWFLENKYSYRKGKPTPELAALTASVDAEMKRIIQRLQAAATTKPKDF